jgi:hypothetical protein
VLGEAVNWPSEADAASPLGGCPPHAHSNGDSAATAENKWEE